MPRLEFANDAVVLRCPRCGEVLTEQLAAGMMCCGACGYEETAPAVAAVLHGAAQAALRLARAIVWTVIG